MSQQSQVTMKFSTVSSRHLCVTLHSQVVSGGLQPMLRPSSQRSHEMCAVHLRAGTVPASGVAAPALVGSREGPTGQSHQQANHGSEHLAEFQAVTRPPLPLPALPGCPLSHRPHAAPQPPCSSVHLPPSSPTTTLSETHPLSS